MAFQLLRFSYSVLILAVSFINCNLAESVNQQQYNPSERVNTTKEGFIRSYHTLGILALAERSIYKVLKEYSDGLVEVIPELTSYLEDYEESTGRLIVNRGLDDFQNLIAGHPLLSTRMVFRFAIQLKLIREILKEKLGLTDLDTLENLIGLPNISDLQDAWSAILRIVHVYDLKVADFATGNILGTQTRSGFTAIHCAQIANFAMQEGFFSQAIEWLEFAKKLVQRENDSTMTYEVVQIFLTNAVDKHDNEFLNETVHDSKFFTQMLLHSSCHSFPRQTRRSYQYELWKGRREINYNTINFWGLCSGDDLRTEEEKSKIFCFYDFKSNPAWYINPLKVEELSKEPYVIQIYEALTDKLSDKLIQYGKANLVKSKVSAPKGQQVSNTRTSASSWLNETSRPEFADIPRRIELMTNLVVSAEESSEILQIASYSFGGHYEIHMDTSKIADTVYNRKFGERVATFMLYLADVDIGGYTAFAQAGIGAKPVKNSAVFWHNLKRSGEIDKLTHHGACPVILGQKWVANKWIRSFSQFSSRKCGLHPSE